MMGRYVFAWASVNGPTARFFDNQDSLLSFASGWCDGGNVTVVNNYVLWGWL